MQSFSVHDSGYRQRGRPAYQNSALVRSRCSTAPIHWLWWMTWWTVCSLRVFFRSGSTQVLCRYCKMFSPLSVLFFSPSAKDKRIFAALTPRTPGTHLEQTPKPQSALPRDIQRPLLWSVITKRGEDFLFIHPLPTTTSWRIGMTSLTYMNSLHSLRTRCLLHLCGIMSSGYPLPPLLLVIQ